MGGAADDYREGYDCGRDEACEHVRRADELVSEANALTICAQKIARVHGKYYDQMEELARRAAMENKLLRQMALGDGEDV